jgi:hypothetical protein
MAVQICTALPPVSQDPVRMKMKELSPKQLSSVPCPTCGVAAGQGCMLHSGGQRSGPHVARKFAATEATERKAKSAMR